MKNRSKLLLLFLISTNPIQILLKLLFAFSFGGFGVAEGAVAKQLTLGGFRGAKFKEKIYHYLL